METTTPKISIDANDASFLALVLTKWLEISTITPTPHMAELMETLKGKDLC